MTDNQPTASGVTEKMARRALSVLSNTGEDWPHSARNIELMKIALKAALSAKPAQGGEDDPLYRAMIEDGIILATPPQPIPTPDEAKEEIRARVIVALDKMIGSGETPSILTGRGRAQIAAACVNAIEDALAAPSPTLDEAGLLPCPFCGSAGKLLALRSGGWRVSCSVFECVIGELDNDFEKRSQAIAGWNVRFAALSRARPEEAIREAALEEAAKVADDMAARYKADWDRFTLHDSKRVLARADQGVTTSKRIAEFIRRLKLKSAHSPAPRVEEKDAI